MTPDAAVSRAELLIGQNRYAQAIELLHQALAASPNDGRAHSLLALCLSENRDQLREATREAETGVHLAPDQPFSHYILSVVLERRNQNEQAMNAIEQALALAPTATPFHAVKAQLFSKQGKWKEALQAAEEGLAHDPEHEQCAAIRVFALERMGRVSDALAESERAVRQAPDSSHAHATRGWALLQKGNYRESQEAFREALRLEPSSEFARSGMIQALNSSNLFFRVFHQAMVWVSRLDSRMQWGLIIGLWFGMRFLRSLARTYPALGPWIFPISIIYLLLVMMSWIMHPLFNTFLRFHPFGKHLLSKKEIWASNLIAGTLVFGGIMGLAIGLGRQSTIAGVLPCLLAIYLTIPISVAFQTTARWAVIVSATAAVAFGLLFLANVVSLAMGTTNLTVLMLFSYGILVYCFVGVGLIRAEQRY